MKQGKQKKGGPKSKITMFLIVVFALMFSTAVVLFGNQMFHQNAVEQSELYDKMYIESAKIESRKTGTGPFNEGSGIPNPGEDYSEDDHYVRTFDVVKYTLSAVIQPNTEANGVDETSTFNGGVVKLRGRIEDSTYFTWQEDAWMQNVVISEDGKEIYAEYIVPEVQLTAPGTQTLTATLKARGTATKEGEEAPTPTFEIWMDGNSPDNENSVKKSAVLKDSSGLYISGKPAFNIKLAKGEVADKGIYNGKSGYYLTYGIQIGLMQDKEGISDLRGLEYPEGDFSIKLNMDYLYKDANTNDNYQLVENVNDTSVVAYSINYEKNSNYYPNNSVAIWNLAGGSYLLTGKGASSIYDSGNINLYQEGAKLEIEFSNYQFNDIFPINSVRAGSGNPIAQYGSNEGYFAVGCIELFSPYYEPEGNKEYDYTLNIRAESANFNTYSKGTGEISFNGNSIDDVLQNDNNISYAMTKRIDGSFLSYFLFSCNAIGLKSGMETEDAYTVLGDIVTVQEFLRIKGGPYQGGAERIVTWRSDAFTFIDNSISIYSVSDSGYPFPSTERITYKYGVYKNNPSEGVITDELVESADFEDFDWYDTEEEAKLNGKIASIYMNDPNHVGYGIRRWMQINLQITDNEKYIGKNPIFRHKFRIYENEDRSGTVHKYAYDKYTNTVYGEDGSFISNGSKYEVGDNLLLIPYHVSVEKTVSDVDSN
ncbi:MAG: hypothetical protein Q4D02_08650, partial [Clostridia bacterium]|nr:hypothetical protein [Clostridia bacterium]